MATKSTKSDSTPARRVRLPISFHPRVFAALGSDLVTNDLVAITELVKNSYDAFASRVDVRFGSDDLGEYIEVLDDGHGMDRETIERVWCVVATPYRQRRPKSRRHGRIRRASGEKGLGRLSAARLGNRLDMVTKARRDACWHVTADWEEIAGAADISLCGVDIEECVQEHPFKTSGTRLRVRRLKSEWDGERVEELKDYLSRLVSPFKQVKGFSIVLCPPGGGKTSVRISPPKFLSQPKYAIEGDVDDGGQVEWTYSFRPVGGDTVRRSVSGTRNWADIRAVDSFGPVPITVRNLDRPGCGPFSFEFRAWDIDPEGVNDIARNYDLGKRSIRGHSSIIVGQFILLAHGAGYASY
jgi:hypothetical protein